MSTAPYLISIDVGATMLKAVLLHRDEVGGLRLMQSMVQPALLVENSLATVIEQFTVVIAQQSQPGSFELVIIGHPPDHPSINQAINVTRLSHEEAITIIAKRLSSTGTMVVVDVGASRTLVALGKYGKVSVEIFPFGVGDQAWEFLRHHTQTHELRSWLAIDISEQDIENYVANKSVYPQIVPLSTKELAIEQALAKVILRQVAAQLPFPWDDIQEMVLTGATLSQPVNLSQPASIILDGLQPSGTIKLRVDNQMVLSALGGAFGHWIPDNYQLSRSILRNSLTSLGTIVCPASDNPKQSMKVTLDTGLATEQKLEVRPGEIIQIPLSDVDGGRLSLAEDSKAQSLDGQSTTRVANGGEVGVIIDGRGRPIHLSAKDPERLAQLNAWDKQLNVHDQIGRIGSAP